MKKAKKGTIALVNRTRNCIGDIHHYLPEKEGEYQIGSWRGHLNIRLVRKLPGLKVKGRYPMEAYTLRDIPIQNLPEKLEFVDTWYLHLTHLKRSGWRHQLGTIGRMRKYKFFGKSKALKMAKDENLLRQIQDGKSL